MRVAPLPDRHPNRDFFIADIFDNLPFKDDMASMQHPMFSLSKKKDMRNLEYEHGHVSISIKPNTDGLPTIFDKDVLLYCGSLLMAEVNQGRIPPQTLRVSSHDLLVATNRRTSGEGYKLLKKALDRLKGVTIKTNIVTNGRVQTRAFGLIEYYEIIESSRIKDRMIRLEIKLSDWFYQSIIGKEVLTINRDYFRLGKPIERRLYEIARKHVGKSERWEIGLERLMEKVGSTGTLRKFRFTIKQLIGTQILPDYDVLLSEDNKVTFYNRQRAEKTPMLPGFDSLPSITPVTLRRGAKIVEESDSGWDYNALHQQFTEQLVSGKFKPKNVNGAFINFLKKKVQERP